jgi:glycosyltransferase involved in cell wall biosynthesis
MKKIGILLTVQPQFERRLFLRQAPFLLKAGFEVDFFCKKTKDSVIDKLNIIDIGKSGAKFARLSGSLNLFRLIKSRKLDVLQVCCVEQLPLGLFVKIFTKTKVIYDCREDMYYSIREHKDNIPKLIRYPFAEVIRFLEYLGCKLFDGMVASDPAIFKTHIAMPENKKVIFYNTPTLELFKKAYPTLNERKYDIVLMGSMSVRTGIPTLLKAYGELLGKGQRIKVLLLGQPTSECLNLINEFKKIYSIKDEIEITGRVPHTDIPSWLSQCRIGYVGLSDMPKFRNNIACKAFEYMACGMPVISSDLPPERLFLEDGKNSILIQPDSSSQLADAIERLLDDIEYAKKLGENGRKGFEDRWNCEMNYESYIQLYTQVLENK